MPKQSKNAHGNADASDANDAPQHCRHRSRPAFGNQLYGFQLSVPQGKCKSSEALMMELNYFKARHRIITGVQQAQGFPTAREKSAGCWRMDLQNAIQNTI